MKFQSVIDAYRILVLRELRIHFCKCPLCGPSLFIRLCNSEKGIRCMKCRATITALSLIKVMSDYVPDLAEKHVYELSAYGYVNRYLHKHAAALTCSEYLAHVKHGSYTAQGVRCEDVQALSFDDKSFDICTSTEVFEHVPDDLRGFREIHRVLKPNGILIFTVPLNDIPVTRERAVLVDKHVQHLVPPEYHDDLLTGSNSVLSFRDYGWDITDRLKSAGFIHAMIVAPDPDIWWGYQRPVVVAEKSP